MYSVHVGMQVLLLMAAITTTLYCDHTYSLNKVVTRPPIPQMLPNHVRVDEKSRTLGHHYNRRQRSANTWRVMSWRASDLWPVYSSRPL